MMDLFDKRGSDGSTHCCPVVRGIILALAFAIIALLAINLVIIHE